MQAIHNVSVYIVEYVSNSWDTLWHKCDACIVNENVQRKISLLEDCNKLLCRLEGGQVQRHKLHLDLPSWKLHAHFFPEPSKSLGICKQLLNTSAGLNPSLLSYLLSSVLGSASKDRVCTHYAQRLCRLVPYARVSARHHRHLSREIHRRVGQLRTHVELVCLRLAFRLAEF